MFDQELGDLILDKPEEIMHCLNCTLPAELCRGRGRCTLGNIRREHGQLTQEVIALVRQGKNKWQISKILNVSPSTVINTIKRAIAKGTLKKEEYEKIMLRKSK